MDLRLALYELSARHGLSAEAAMRLARWAGLEQTPADLARRVAQGVAVLAAALGGFGMILWLAANWDTLGRFGRFALLEGVIIVMSLGAFLRPAWRAPLSLMALLCTGGLFAYFGQTYQTGADPWQLFAVWAVLTLPLCLGARSDVAWTPWALVVMTAISLWVHAHTDHSWRVERSDIGVHLVAWAMTLGLSAALSPQLQRWTGAGAWAWRLGLTLATMALTLTASASLFSHEVSALYMLGLLMLGSAAIVLTQARFFDAFALSVVALGLNVLLVFGLGDALFNGHHNEWLGSMFLLGLCAAGLLAGSVSVILRCSRRQAAAEGASA
ncbi:MAG: DUF2157 domain-containing protein [Ideonella sp. MAG2]|nr:MAG: DUF2157 domain-containing protein [Ideonella sp. MAG2]